MKCGVARELFGAYWDDEITLAERDWLESHFAACVACRAEYEGFARTIELVGSLPRAEVKPDLAERALARARRAAATADRLPHETPRWIPITATAALLLIAATTGLQWMGVTPGGRGPDPAPVASVSQPELLGVPTGVPTPAGSSQTPAEVSGSAPGSELIAGAEGDSLFDHTADVEFILDPIVMRKGRAHTTLPMDPQVKGAKAVITF